MKEKLTELVNFRLTAADHAVCLRKAKAAGIKPSEFFRGAVLGNEPQIIARQKASPERGQLLYLMNKASNNINQLAYRANADHKAGIISENTYIKIITELQLLTQTMKEGIKNVD